MITRQILIKRQEIKKSRDSYESIGSPSTSKIRPRNSCCNFSDLIREITNNTKERKVDSNETS